MKYYLTLLTEYINVATFKNILKNFTRFPNLILKYLESAFYILSNKQLLQQSYRNYFDFSIRSIILNELDEFNNLFEKVVVENQNFNSNHYLYHKHQKLNTAYTVFFFIIYSLVTYEEKSNLLFCVFDSNSENFLNFNDNLLKFLSLYIEQCLYMADFAGNFYLKDKLEI